AAVAERRIDHRLEGAGLLDSARDDEQGCDGHRGRVRESGERLGHIDHARDEEGHVRGEYSHGRSYAVADEQDDHDHHDGDRQPGLEAEAGRDSGLHGQPTRSSRARLTTGSTISNSPGAQARMPYGWRGSGLLYWSGSPRQSVTVPPASRRMTSGAHVSHSP